MKKFNLFLIVLLSGVLLSFSCISDTITIVADQWEPYNGTPDSGEEGYGIEITKLIFEKAGHIIDYKLLPWNRAVLQTEKGDFNAVIGAYLEDTPDFIFPKEEFGISVNAFFTKKESTWKYNGLESLLPIKVGLIKDYSYGEELDEFFQAHQEIVEYIHGDDPLLKNIQKLLVGRFDVLVEDENVLKQKAKKMGVAEKIAMKGKGNGNKVYIAFSPNIKKSKEYAEIFTKGIRELKASGELDKILEKYGLNYWK